MEEKLEKKTLADCWNHVVEGTRRVWVQGHVVSLDGAQHTAVIDDGTATFPLNFHADDNQKGCGLGEYTMIIGNWSIAAVAHCASYITLGPKPRSHVVGR